MPDENEKYEFSWPKFVKYCRENNYGEWDKLEPLHWEDVDYVWQTWVAAIQADRSSK